MSSKKIKKVLTR